MGLDTVELVMQVEESFDITISDEHASQMRTVGDVYSFIIHESRGKTRGHDRCLNAATFYELRRWLVLHVEDASQLRPSSVVAATLPAKLRRSIWSQLADDMGLHFPPLRRPYWLAMSATICVFVSSALAFLFFLPFFGFGWAIAITLVVLIFSALVAVVTTTPFAYCPSESFHTYRGLVTQLVALNYVELAQRENSWKANEVWTALQNIIVEQLGVEKEIVTPDADFVIDLGCD